MLVKSVRTVSREFYLEKMCLHWAYFIWLAEGVAKVLCCARICLHAVYHQQNMWLL